MLIDIDRIYNVMQVVERYQQHNIVLLTMHSDGDALFLRIYFNGYREPYFFEDRITNLFFAYDKATREFKLRDGVNGRCSIIEPFDSISKEDVIDNNVIYKVANIVAEYQQYGIYRVFLKCYEGGKSRIRLHFEDKEGNNMGKFYDKNGNRVRSILFRYNDEVLEFEPFHIERK